MSSEKKDDTQKKEIIHLHSFVPDSVLFSPVLMGSQRAYESSLMSHFPVKVHLELEL